MSNHKPTPVDPTPETITDADILAIAGRVESCPVLPWWLKDDVAVGDVLAAVLRFARALLDAAPQPAEQPDPHPDDAAVDRFAAAMKAKLAKKRNEGRTGWQSMTSEQLSTLLHQNGQRIEQQPALAKYQPCGCVVCTCEHETQCQGCGAHHCGTHPVGQFHGPVYQQPAPDVAGLEEAPITVIYTDGCGAGRRSPADCRYGVRYITVADTVYWPLSADDAQRLRSAECGRGDFTGPANECPALVEALEMMVEMMEFGGFGRDAAMDTARAALAANRKKGGEE